MKLAVSFLLLFIATKSLAQFANPTAAASLLGVTITHVTIIDTRNGKEIPRQNVVINNGRISKIENDSSPVLDGSIIVNGSGKFLIPGLWDMEVHLSWCKASSLPLLVAEGVTDVRDMGGDFSEIANWKTEVAHGIITGPHILQVGPMLNGKSYNRYQLATGDSAQVRGVVRALKFMGADGLEIERRVPKDVFEALMDEAKRQGLPVGGHIQLAVSPEEASNAGQHTIENIESLYYGTFDAGIEEKDVPNAIAKFLDSPASDTLFSTMAKNHTAVTPVLDALDWILHYMKPGAIADPNSVYVALSLRKNTANASPEVLEMLQHELPELLKTVNKMYAKGIVLLAGTDIAGSRIPGFSLHAELKEFTNAGLSPLVALQTATINPAIVLGLEKDYGSVENGKVANLVLLDADPLINIDNTSKINTVILNGKIINTDNLVKLSNQAKEMARHE